jgi:hypothetical protein
VAKRKSTGKRERFEIFKRDRFRCVYCGRSPPEVLLHVDHIIAVANGGTSDATNLATACADCNGGKSAVPLTAVTASIQKKTEEALERAEQMQAMAEAAAEARAAEEQVIEQIGTAWFNAFVEGEDHNRLTFGPSRIPTVRRFLRDLPPDELLRAIDITAEAAERPGNWALQVPKDFGRYDDERRFRYFCGVCWRAVRERKGEA